MILAAARLYPLAALVLTAAPQVPAGMVESGRWSCNVDGTSRGVLPVSVERVTWLMGTEMRAVACAESRQSGVAALESAFRAIREVEKRLSTWIPDSELSRLNTTTPGRWVDLSPATTSLLAEMREWSVRTRAAFDPGVGTLLDAWDIRGTGRVPTDTGLARALAAAGIRHVQIDPEDGCARRLRDIRLDAGAFGKGAGLRAAVAELRSAEGLHSAVLNFGGQIEIVAESGGRRTWMIEVADPARRSETAEKIRVGPGSVATTGASERFIEVDGRRFGHVIDPRSGRPVPAWGSVTVVASDPVTADVLSTALFVMGPEAAREWSRDLDVGVLLQIGVGEERNTLRNEALRSLENQYDGGIELNVPNI
ncbi:MAG: FAD:protein FMN transferase [Gemmatimonadota bacterium]